MSNLRTRFKTLFSDKLDLEGRLFSGWSIAAVLFALLTVFLLTSASPERKALLFDVGLMTAVTGAIGYALWRSFQIHVARLLFDLAAGVASMGEDLTEKGARRIERNLEQLLHLSASGRARLQAHLEDRLGHSPTAEEFKRGIQALPKTDRYRLARFLSTIVAVEGTIPKKELAPMLKMLRMLGFDVETDPLKEKEGASGKDWVPKINRVDGNGEREMSAEEQTGDVVTGSDRQKSHPPKQDGLQLDTEKVKEIEDETRDAARVLREVFQDPDQGANPQTGPDSEFDEDFSRLVSALEEQVRWPREEFERIVDDHGLVPGHVREHINEVAMTEVGEPLIEGDNPIELNARVLESLRS